MAVATTAAAYTARSSCNWRADVYQRPALARCKTALNNTRNKTLSVVSDTVVVLPEEEHTLRKVP